MMSKIYLYFLQPIVIILYRYLIKYLEPKFHYIHIFINTNTYKSLKHSVSVEVVAESKNQMLSIHIIHTN